MHKLVATRGLSRAAVDEIERIRAANGGAVSPADLVEAARGNPENPLHPYFTWDRDEAAEEMLLVQAKSLLRRVKVIYTTGTQAPVRVSAYVSVPEDRGRDMRSYYLAQEMADEDKAISVLREISWIVGALTRKIEALKGIMGGDFSDLDDVVGRLDGIVQRMRKRSDYGDQPNV